MEMGTAGGLLSNKRGGLAAGSSAPDGIFGERDRDRDRDREGGVMGE